MKKLILAPLAAALLLLVAACETTSTSAPRGKVVVNYDHPEKFTDVESSYSNGTQMGYLENLTAWLQTKAGAAIKPDETLTMTFTDIDMAGAIGMNARANQTRVMRSNYPVRLNFSYSVTDATGKVVKQGTEELVNNFPGTQTGINKSDPLFHEKDELESWIRSKLK